MDTTKVNIDGVTVEVDSSIVANVHMEQKFCINGEVHVTVNVYESHGVWRMTIWMNDGTEEFDTKDIDKDVNIMSNDEIIAMMEAFVHEDEDYILEMAE